MKSSFRFHIPGSSFNNNLQTLTDLFDSIFTTDLSGNLNILPTFVPDGCGLAGFSCILYSLLLILVSEEDVSLQRNSGRASAERRAGAQRYAKAREWRLEGDLSVSSDGHLQQRPTPPPTTVWSDTVSYRQGACRRRRQMTPELRVQTDDMHTARFL
ncbi:hypothetical protein NQZ68_021627 [Dissostichus eleginoides]|nr:hypothetical protein NQZ68_021627 [Dissostichus eleginoides]